MLHAHPVQQIMNDKLLAWTTAVWSQGGEDMASYMCFLQHFQMVFAHSPEGKEIGEKLLGLKQEPKHY